VRGTLPGAHGRGAEPAFFDPCSTFRGPLEVPRVRSSPGLKGATRIQPQSLEPTVQKVFFIS
jgi:hypothetical protein